MSVVEHSSGRRDASVKEASDHERERALRDEAQRKLREAKRRYGFAMDAGNES